MFPVIFHEAADTEAEEAVSWYAGHGERLGTARRESIEEIIDRIRLWPESCPVTHGSDVRGAHTLEDFLTRFSIDSILKLFLSLRFSIRAEIS